VVYGVPNCFPEALVTPAGTVTVSVPAGTRGAVATKEKASGVTTCQVPATAGVRVGVGEWGSRGLENWTVMVASVGTWVL